MKCNNCGGEIPEGSLFCNLCGTKVEYNNTENNTQNITDNNAENVNSNNDEKQGTKQNNIIIILLILLFICGIGFGVHKVIKANSVPTCDSKFAKDLVLDIFKQNNAKYTDYMHWDLLNSVEVTTVEPISYDKDLKKYECTARIKLFPKTGRVPGLPKYNWANTGRVYMFYEYASCDVDYSIYKEQGEYTVKSSYCSNGLKYNNLVNNSDAINL